MNAKQFFIKWSRHGHRLLLLPALLALLVFVLSAFMHLLLTWTGPQTHINKPPQQLFTHHDFVAIPDILRQNRVMNASIIKLVPSSQGSLLQVTESRQSPRRYFNVDTRAEIAGQDEQQARWLADYYLDNPSRRIQSVSFQTAFDDDYPWVNRLLPVYKIVYEGDDGLTLYIHTETQTMASISNHWKHDIQWLFRQFHTWAWLENFRHGRVVLMLLLLCSLLAMLVSGLTMLYSLKRSHMQDARRRGHRLLAHVIGIPLLGFSASGIWHLLHHEYAETVRDFNLSQPLILKNDLPVQRPHTAFANHPLHQIALITVNGTLMYRASLAWEAVANAGEHDHHQVRQERFNGIPAEQGSFYISMDGTEMTGLNDETVARQLTIDYLSITNEQILAVNKVTHFGPDYDFRNKRLPVWKITVDSPEQEALFVDVASGVLVDRVNRASRLEGYSFSFLHKWNFLTMPLGREKRDLLIALILMASLVLAGLGYRLRKRH